MTIEYKELSKPTEPPCLMKNSNGDIGLLSYGHPEGTLSKHEHNKPPYYTTHTLFFKRVAFVIKDKGTGWMDKRILKIFFGKSAFDSATTFAKNKKQPKIEWDFDTIEKAITTKYDPLSIMIVPDYLLMPNKDRVHYLPNDDIKPSEEDLNKLKELYPYPEDEKD